jgi:large subunit ribosomal protein L4
VKLSVYNQAGEVVGDVEVADAVFGVDAHVALMHQVVVAQHANARVGTASTKTRAMVAGTTKKIYKQKGTGRARHGSRKVALWTGGGVTHGPHPRSYEQHTPKKMRRLAIRSALSVKARDNQIVLLESVAFDRPRTKDMIGMLDKLPVGGKVLITLDEGNQNMVLSARNIPNVHTLPALSLNTRDLLNHDYLIATVPAIRQVEQWLGNGQVEVTDDAITPRPAARRAAAATTAPVVAEPTQAKGRHAEAADAPEVTDETEAAPRPTRARAAAKAESAEPKAPRATRAGKADDTDEAKPATSARAAKPAAAKPAKAAPAKPAAKAAAAKKPAPKTSSKKASDE